jgi:nuclear-control-of-ATPase protein 2
VYTDDVPTPHVRRLQNVISSVSVTSKTQPLLSSGRLAELLSDPALTHSTPAAETRTDDAADYLWLVAAKAAVQTSSLLMNTLLDYTLQLHEEIYYWNEVLGSVWYSGLYAAQTSPVRLWHWTKGISPGRNVHDAQASLSRSIAARWARFHQIARQSMRGMSDYPVYLNLSSPIRSCRSEIRQKRDLLLSMKDIHTCSLGLLMEGWHLFQAKDFVTASSTGERKFWQDAVSRTVVLTEAILQQVVSQSNTDAFEQRVLATLEEDTASLQMQSGLSSNQPVHLIQRLINILQEQLPKHKASMSAFISDHGRPSRLTRYWLPVLTAVMSSSASLRLLLRRQDEIIQWIFNIGTTIVDFGSNWVVEPIHKLVGTIRHDEKSEIAIMSKNSLLADRASLERMVIDFVRDRPDPDQSYLAGEDTMAIANAVKEGDLTPVLRAYERDLRSPFVGTVRGDLIRALLIQIQKTKVDVEIAISGINSLLKSQELVFG